MIDEDIDRRLVAHLRHRGYRDATCVRDHGLEGKGDHIIIPALRRLSPPVVLVTFDNDMPYTHRALLEALRLPLAIVDSAADRGELKEMEFHFDVVHRWAHLICGLQPGKINWYRRDGYAAHTVHSLPDKARRRRSATRSRDSKESYAKTTPSDGVQTTQDAPLF